MTRYTPLWEQAGQYAASVDRRLIGALWPAAASTGCAVTVSSGMTVNIAPGTIVVPTGNSTGSVLCTSDAVEQVTLAAAPGSGTNRWDVVICQARGNDLDGGANNDFLFTTVTGTAAASPTVPATPANAVGVANIYVPGGSASVTAGNITDIRPGNLPVPVATTTKARVYRNAAWTTASANVIFDTRSYDPRLSFNLGNGLYTCPVAGDYFVTAQYTYVAQAAAEYAVGQLKVNGTVVVAGPAGFAAANGNQVSGFVTDILACNAGDTLALGQGGIVNRAGVTAVGTFMTVRLMP